MSTKRKRKKSISSNTSRIKAHTFVILTIHVGKTFFLMSCIEGEIKVNVLLAWKTMQRKLTLQNIMIMFSCCLTIRNSLCTCGKMYWNSFYQSNWGIIWNTVLWIWLSFNCSQTKIGLQIMQAIGHLCSSLAMNLFWWGMWMNTILEKYDKKALDVAENEGWFVLLWTTD